MGARTRLNRAYVNGSLVLAAVIGLLSGSWLVFTVALVALLAVNLLFGEIRLASRRRHR